MPTKRLWQSLQKRRSSVRPSSGPALQKVALDLFPDNRHPGSHLGVPPTSYVSGSRLRTRDNPTILGLKPLQVGATQWCRRESCPSASASVLTACSVHGAYVSATLCQTAIVVYLASAFAILTLNFVCARS